MHYPGAAVLLAILNPGEQPPDGYLSMVRARQSIRSCVIQAVGVDYQRAPDRRVNYIARLARNGDYIIENRGDQDGWTRKDPSGRWNTKFPILQCRNSEGYWGTLLTERFLNVADTAPTGVTFGPMLRLNALALTPRPQDLYSEKDVLEIIQGGDRRWGQEKKNGRVVVTLQMSSDEYIQWFIDPQRGWVADRIDYGAGRPLEDGDRNLRVAASCIATLEEVDGVWFPTTVDYYVGEHLASTYTILDAEFNRPSHPARFTPNDIGAEPGFTVSRAGETESNSIAMIWDGDKIVSPPDFLAAVKAGKTDWGPTIKARRNGEHSPYATEAELATLELDRERIALRGRVRRFESMWEHYVRRFVEKHKLDEDQTKEAYQILKECQQKGHSFLESAGDRISDLEQKLAEAAKAGDKDRFRKCSEELSKMAAPLDRIFEEGLKPRLDRLLTPAQKAAAAR